MSFYFVMDIVSTVAYGDILPENDLERVTLVLLINIGDALFAVAFGLLAGIMLNMSRESEAEKVFSKMSSLDQVLGVLAIDGDIKKQVRDYYQYEWTLKK